MTAPFEFFFCQDPRSLWLEAVAFQRSVTFYTVDTLRNAMNDMKIDWNVQGAEKANGTESTSRWFQTGYFFRVAECGNLCKIEANVNLVV